jgi:transposase-like protein
MSTLIPYMSDRLAAADWFHAGRWPDGQVSCPECGATGEAIEPLGRNENGIHRHSCHRCAQAKGRQTAIFTDWTTTLFEGSHVPPEVWGQIIHHWQLGLPNGQIAWAPDLAYDTVEQACKLLDGALYETYHLDPERCLSGHVEADELYQTAGAKGRPDYVRTQLRSPRRRGLSERGRGSWDKDRPPILGLVQRRDRDDRGRPEERPAQVFLEVLPNVQTRTIRPIILARVTPGSILDTDDYDIYNFAEEAGYQHRTVNHAQGEYARGDVHVNTEEGIWSALRPLLARFRGLSKRFLHLPVVRFEFLHNHGHLSPLARAQMALRYFFQACRRYLRQMVRKRRRILFTPFYP